MARIRSIFPGFWTDEVFASLSDAAALFYLGLLNEADDQGIFEWKPVTLRMRLRPTKDGSVEDLLAELAAANTIQKYENDGRQYGAIRNFRKYQRPKSPKFIHHTDANIRNYIGTTHSNSEIERGEEEPVPQKVEKSPQREEGGGSRKRKEVGDSSVSSLRSETAQIDESDPEKATYQRGKQILGPNSGGMIRNLIKAKGGNIALARAAIEQASTKENPKEYVAGAIRQNGSASSTAGPREPTQEELWLGYLRWYAERGTWQPAWGDPPGDVDCDVPNRLIEAFNAENGTAIPLSNRP